MYDIVYLPFTAKHLLVSYLRPLSGLIKRLSTDPYFQEPCNCFPFPGKKKNILDLKLRTVNLQRRRGF